MRCAIFRSALASALIASALIASAATAASTIPPAPRDPLPELAVVLVSHESVLEANFPDAVDTLGLWLKTAIDTCKRELAAEKKPPLLLVQATFEPDGLPVYELAGKPTLSRALSARLSKALTQLPALHPAVCRITVRLQSETEGGDPFAAAKRFKPVLATPDEVALAALAKAPLADKSRLVRTWARTEVIPVLAHLASSVDEKFAGVRETGAAVNAVDLGATIDVQALTYRAPAFWRGTMEMSPGNALISALPALLFAANGQFDRADSILAPLIALSDYATLGAMFLIQLKARLDLVNAAIRTEIERGIKLHDRGRFDEALAVYQAVLAACPETAWARYEIFYSTLMKSGPEAVATQAGRDLWNAAAPAIYASDPLYTSQFQAERGKSMGALFDRLTLQSLHKSTDTAPGERLGTLAHVALHLEAYGEAAQLHWALLHTRLTPAYRMLKEENSVTLTGDDLLIRFLYCLEQLGAPDLKSNFTLEFAPAFEQLERDLTAHRTQ